MKFRSKFLMKPSFTTGILLFVILIIPLSLSAPALDDDESEGGCYYMFAHYDEGDRILTNEPCLNCTCHNSMLMCYLRVCPFTKPIGQDCTVEKRPDQCCPTITCPEVPVSLVTPAGLISTTTTPGPVESTDLAIASQRGCDIEGQFYPDGAQVAIEPSKPCELCYCIRNRTACVMQECTLHVEGCEPVFEHGVCCPVRYQCDIPPGIESTTIAGLISTTVASIFTTAPTTSGGCYRDGEYYHDGSQIPTPGEAPCEHCYCMRGEIVCAVQDCGSPLENEEGNCKAIPPRVGLCCPEKYTCHRERQDRMFDMSLTANETTTEAFTNMTTKPASIELPVTTLVPAQTVTESTSKTSEGIEVTTMEVEGIRDKGTEVSTESPPESTESIEAQASTTLAAVHSSSTESPHSATQPAEELHDEKVTTSETESPVEGKTSVPPKEFVPTSETPETSTEQSEEIEATTSEIHVAPSHPGVSSRPEIIETTPETMKPPSSAPTHELEEKKDNATVPVTTKPELETTTASSPVEHSSPHSIILGETTSEVEKEAQTETIVTSEATETSLGDETESYTTSEATVIKPAAAAGQPIPTKQTEVQLTESSVTELPTTSQQPTTIKQEPEVTTVKLVSESSTQKLEIQNVTSTEIVLEPQEGTTPSVETQNQVMGQTVPPPAEMKKPEASTQTPTDEAVTAQEKVGAPENMISTHAATAQTESTTIKQSVTEASTISIVETTTTPKAPVQVEVSTESPSESSKESEGTTTAPLDDEKSESTSTKPKPLEESSTSIPSSVSSEVPEVGTEKISESSTESDEKESTEESSSSISPVSPSHMTVPGEGSSTEKQEEEADMTTVASEAEEKVSITTTQPEVHDVVSGVTESSKEPEHSTVSVTTSSSVSAVTQPQITQNITSTPAGVEVVTESATEPLMTETPEPKFPISSSEESFTAKPEEVEKEETTISSDENKTQPPSTESYVKDQSTEGPVESSPPEVVAGMTTKRPESTTEIPKPQGTSESSTERVPSSSEEIPQSDEKPTEHPSEKESQSSDVSESSSTESVEEVEKTTIPTKVELESSTETGEVTKMASTIIPIESSSQATSEKETEKVTSIPNVTEAEVSSKAPTTPMPIEMDTQSTEAPPHSADQSDETQGTTTPSAEFIESTTVSMTRIPGEGSCFVEGITYKNGSRIPPSTPCQLACACQNSIVHCLLVHCPPAPMANGLEKCRPVYTPETCCPKYECEEESSSTPVIVTPESSVGVSTGPSIVTVTPESVKPEAETEKPLDSELATKEPVTEQESTTEPVFEMSQSPQSVIISQATEISVPKETEATTQTVLSPQLPEITTPVPPPPASIQLGKETTLTPIESKVGNETEISEMTTTESEIVMPGSQTSEPIKVGSQTGEVTTVQSVSIETESTTSASSVTHETHEEKGSTPASAPTLPEISESTPASSPGEIDSKIGNGTAESPDAMEPTSTISSQSHPALSPINATTETPQGVPISTEGVEGEKVTVSSITGESSTSTERAEEMTTTHLPEVTSSSTERVTTESQETSAPIHEIAESSSPISVPSHDEVETIHEVTPSSTSTELTTVREEMSTIASIVESLQNATTETIGTNSTAKYPVTMSTTVTPSPAPWPYPSSTTAAPAMSNGACLFDSRVYMSAQQIPRDDPCDFCFCFRGDIICLQQSCPPPIPGCYEEPIPGFCCPRYECPVGSNSTAPPQQIPPAYYHTQLLGNQHQNTSNTASSVGATGPGCEIQGEYYEQGQLIVATSGPCLECRCGSGGMMECDPRECQPEPMLRKMIEAISSR